jgi:hypothetical protein
MSSDVKDIYWVLQSLSKPSVITLVFFFLVERKDDGIGGE